ncbi:MAG TPA: 2OG-Fe(II) oxygenase [Rhizomicrobium sp.]|nr:2OG-Fe(II) oxygenase [Rhizomicrobium sp.]
MQLRSDRRRAGAHPRPHLRHYRTAEGRNGKHPDPALRDGPKLCPAFRLSGPVASAHCRDDRAGQRVATFLVYLNDDFDAAETSFLRLDWRYRGQKGDAILFWNVDQAGVPDSATLHAGLAPTRGEKWLLSQWIRLPPARSAQGL